jgi:hypothetical protein
MLRTGRSCRRRRRRSARRGRGRSTFQTRDMAGFTHKRYGTPGWLTTPCSGCEPAVQLMHNLVSSGGWLAPLMVAVSCMSVRRGILVVLAIAGACDMGIGTPHRLSCQRPIPDCEAEWLQA